MKHDNADAIEEAEIFMSVVVPAYNEEKRLGGMLEEAVSYLQREYGDAHSGSSSSGVSSSTMSQGKPEGNGSVKRTSASQSLNGIAQPSATSPARGSALKGWEILIISDGSTDATCQVALDFAREHQLSLQPHPIPGPWSPDPNHPAHIPHGSIRVVTLAQNRGKGGAVTHGMRHVRGQYVVFADADGASKFDDLGKLVSAAEEAQDSRGRAVAIGSRAHLVGTEAVVKVRIPPPSSSPTWSKYVPDKAAKMFYSARPSEIS